jgi:tRNA(Ile2) C34 agmatinyltransferase TiaS
MALEAASGMLKLRVESLATVRKADHSTACDHCGAPQAVEKGQPKHKCSECGKSFDLEW